MLGISMEEKVLTVIQETEILGKSIRMYNSVEVPLFLASDVAEWIDYAKNPNGSRQTSKMVKAVDEDEKLVVKLLPPDEKEGRFLLNEIMQAGNFGHYDKRIKRVANESALHVFLRRTIRNLRFIRSYPSEVLWTPLFKIWHFTWRKYHGY